MVLGHPSALGVYGAWVFYRFRVKVDYFGAFILLRLFFLHLYGRLLSKHCHHVQ